MSRTAWAALAYAVAMTGLPALVLLPSAAEDPAVVEALSTALSRSYDVLPAPRELTTEGPFSLAGLATQVAAGMDAAKVPAAAVCGLGLGAMTALQLAGTAPERVTRLVLLTRQVRLAPMLMSLPAAVVRLLPAARLQRLGAGSDQLVALLDQVRPVDVRPLAPRVQAPAVVLCGARDRVNRAASAALARALPQAELRLVPKAGAGWAERQPGLLADAVGAAASGR